MSSSPHTFRRARQRGFTLIELMMVVAIIGILSMILLPTFLSYARRAKSSEATNNLKSLFVGAVAYYENERQTQGLSAMNAGGCTVGAAGPLPASIGTNKQIFDFSGDASFRDLGFTVSDQIYFAYGIDSAGNTCGGGASRTDVYTFFAEGDLNGDGTRSRFELAVGTNAEDRLYRAPGFYITNELE